MTDLQSYLDRLQTEDPMQLPYARKLLEAQWMDATNLGIIRCFDCTLTRSLEHAYRCLYCGIWFCSNCAEKHFGKSIAEHIRQKRIERRQELENVLNPS